MMNFTLSRLSSFFVTLVFLSSCRNEISLSPVNSLKKGQNTLRDCGELKSGDLVSRNMFHAPSVAQGLVCNSETQSQTCDDGELSDWSGTFGSSTCTLSDGSQPAIGTPSLLTPVIESTFADTTTLVNVSWTPVSGATSYLVRATESDSDRRYPGNTGGNIYLYIDAYVPSDMSAPKIQIPVMAGHSYVFWVHAFKPNSIYGHSSRTFFSIEDEGDDTTGGSGDNTVGGSTGGGGSPVRTVACVPGETESRKLYQAESVASGQTCQRETQTRVCIKDAHGDDVFGPWSGAGFDFPHCYVRSSGPTVLNIPLSGSDRRYSNPNYNGGQPIIFGKNILNQVRTQVVLDGADTVDPISHSNQILFNTTIDGYGGHPYGRCFTKAACTGVSGFTDVLDSPEALLMIWGTSRIFRNLLIKNVEVKNAAVFEPGPHVDVLQTYTPMRAGDEYMIGYQDWFVIQDSILKNSDHNTMIMETNYFKGSLYQNVSVVGLDSAFMGDCLERLKTNGGSHCGGNTRISAGYPWRPPNNEPRATWMVNVMPPDKTSVEVDSNLAAYNPQTWGPIIMVGPKTKSFTVWTNFKVGNSWERAIRTEKVYRYDTIEEALQVHARPPFIELSCSGWASPPAGCTNGIGTNR
jgi:hypothetical protein